ncbi:MAG: hypothetical protein CL917_05230 [Deltaproteobacteria bacterium]|nr:hypothetical protein [Deltaproteobacteria bacterium]
MTIRSALMATSTSGLDCRSHRRLGHPELKGRAWHPLMDSVGSESAAAGRRVGSPFRRGQFWGGDDEFAS